MITKEKILKEVLKDGQCPDCSKKVDKCDCDFKELYVTLKIKKVEEAIDLTLAEVGKVIDDLQSKIDKNKSENIMDTGYVRACNSAFDILEELKQKLGIK